MNDYLVLWNCVKSVSPCHGSRYGVCRVTVTVTAKRMRGEGQDLA
jgi:hypothetical protein